MNEKQKRKVVERREAGIKAMPAPPARSLPPDHPARSMFREVADAERHEETRTSTPPSSTSDLLPPPTTSYQPTAPEKDFTRVYNSVTRDAIPAGLFKGNSKKVYDVLYQRTRGAITPVRQTQIKHSELIDRAKVSHNTLRSHLRHLETVGLVVRKWELGNNDGAMYEVFIPEELPPPTTSYHHVLPPPTSSQNLVGGTTQNLVGGGGSQLLDSQDTSGEPKTSFKTVEENIDDEAFAGLISQLKAVTAEITGKAPSSSENERWRELGELLIGELRAAAERTSVVSSVPALLTEHLKRRLNKPAPTQPMPVTAPPHVTPTLATDEELVSTFVDFLHGGMTLADLDGNLSKAVEPTRWPAIRALVVERYETERSHMAAPGESPSGAGN